MPVVAQLCQHVATLVLQGPRRLEHPDVLPPGQLRSLKLLREKLAGHLKVPAAHALQQSVHHGDFTIHRADGVIFRQQLLPPSRQAVLGDGLVRRERVVKLAQDLLTVPHAVLPTSLLPHPGAVFCQDVRRQLCGVRSPVEQRR